MDTELLKSAAMLCILRMITKTPKKDVEERTKDRMNHPQYYAWMPSSEVAAEYAYKVRIGKGEDQYFSREEVLEMLKMLHRSARGFYGIERAEKLGLI